MYMSVLSSFPQVDEKVVEKYSNCGKTVENVDT